MKIHRIELENFKPYGKVVLPDIGEGLCLVQGNNSMGKTSFIEAMLWGLLGDGLMDVQQKKMLVRRGESSCMVEITFDLAGIQYRILRKMILKRSRTLNSEPDFKAEAILLKKMETSSFL